MIKEGKFGPMRTDAARRHLETLNHRSGGSTELAIMAPCQDGSMRIVATGFFDDHDTLLKAAEQHSGVAHVYVGVNPRPVNWMTASCDGSRRAKDADIEFVSAVLLDIDPVDRGSGELGDKHAHGEALAAAERIADKLGGAVIDSGGGAYVVLPLMEPALVADLGGAEPWKRHARAWRANVVEPLVADLPVRIDDTADLSRLCRLAGTRNVKGEGRETAWLRDARDCLEPETVLAVEVDDRATPAAPVGKKIAAGQRNTNLTSLAGTMRRRGMNAAEIEAALQETNRQRCTPPLDSSEVRGIAESVQRYDAAEESFHLSDLGNSKRIVAAHGRDMRYCYPWRKWVVWDGRRWRMDDSVLAPELAKDLPGIIYAEAANCDDPDRRAALGKHAHRTEARARLDNALALARSSLPVAPSELNRKPWLLNAHNGTIDLRTGELKPHRREDLSTQIANVTYNPDAEAPRWERFLLEVMGGDERMVAFLQRAVGCSLVGSPVEHVLFFLHGGGRNGKSTLLGTVRVALGDYALEASHDLLTTISPNRSRHPTIIADLFCRRFVTTIEVERGAHMAEALMTWLTGGDTLRARRMREDAWEFDPQHTFWLAANNKPRVQSRTAAVWERIKLVPFEVSFGDGPDFDFPREPGIEQILRGEDGDDSPDRGELPGVLAWAVEGCLAWQREGLDVPGEVRSATELYRDEEDDLGRFFDDECVVSDDLTVKFSDLWARYLEWCGNAVEKPVTKTALGRELTERGFAKDTSKSEAWRLGIGLREQDGMCRDEDRSPAKHYECS